MQRKKAIKTVLASTVSLLGVGLIILLTTFTASAASATFTVTNTNDSGGGQLTTSYNRR